MNVLQFTDSGIYCPAGDFYIDPWKPVTKAVITHAHSDHARPGNQQYLCHEHSVPLLQLRLGQDITVQGVKYGETTLINGVQVQFYPAGHMIGSAQIKVTVGGQSWVVSGDYKTENDGISEAFEPVKCHVFITESTFGLPIYTGHHNNNSFRISANGAQPICAPEKTVCCWLIVLAKHNAFFTT
ncbi:hypothetical protein MKQ70_21070 [Chitinophaga sedimenti]|uniref:hypothetical protein n=1 Tax=Chitinophaga sedimenti TaxID=2033606 RepID=UPI00200485A4|nr:hypothetical protein [Chitinophaga sedimenti]MCK7557359.1 hypothetical protein [Chitinophaga sedimenti]